MNQTAANVALDAIHSNVSAIVGTTRHTLPSDFDNAEFHTEIPVGFIVGVYQDTDDRFDAVATTLAERYVKTCHSDTCSCVSHDPGYTDYLVAIPPFVVPRTYGASVHSHASTGVDVKASLALAKVLEAARTLSQPESLALGRLRIMAAEDFDATRQKAAGEKARKIAAFNVMKSDALGDWADRGLAASAIWAAKIPWSRESGVMNLAADLVEMGYAPDMGSLRGRPDFERKVGFPTPLSWPRTLSAVWMADLTLRVKSRPASSAHLNHDEESE